MASTPSLPEKDPEEAISEDGFFKAEDMLLGQHIQEIDDHAVPYTSRRGLQFCKDNILGHPVSTPSRLYMDHASNFRSAFNPSSAPCLNGLALDFTDPSGLAPSYIPSTAP